MEPVQVLGLPMQRWHLAAKEGSDAIERDLGSWRLTLECEASYEDQIILRGFMTTRIASLEAFAVEVQRRAPEAGFAGKWFATDYCCDDWRFRLTMQSTGTVDRPIEV